MVAEMGSDTFDVANATAESVAAATDQAIAAADAIVAAAIAPGATRSVRATLLPLDAARGVIADAQGSAGFMAIVHSDRAVRAAGHAATERLEHWVVDQPFDPQVAVAVKELAATDEAGALTGELEMLLRATERDVRKAGHDLAPEAGAEVHAAMARLVEIGVRFNQHLGELTDELVVDQQDLDGLPDEYRQRLAVHDDGRARITMAHPDVLPFLENARNRERRHELCRMFENRAADTNTALLAEAVALRERVAELFGQPSWAHHVMDETMAQRPEAVEDFYARLVPALTAKAAAEIAVMADRLEDDEGTDDVQLWDWRYYDNQLRTTEYGVDNQAVTAYFPLQQVLDGLFEITGEVFGLEYRPVNDAPVWHPDVRTFSIVDRATRLPIAVVHMDLHPRDGKFGHFAAFDVVRGRRLLDGTHRTPVSAIVANFTKPTTDSPSLLAHDEVVTLFHEFGHVLHQTLTRAETARYSGSNTERDFVEAPSQIMEHWCWQPDVLARIARHHATGAPMPPELIEQLIAARDLDIAIVTLRQIQFGVLDMGLHGPRDPQDQPLPDGSRDLDAILRRAESISMFAHVDGTFMPGAFGHLFAGYDAGYYGYLWSKVYGDDMFSRFRVAGITNPDIGHEYRAKILEPGGGRPATAMLEDFLGRPPDDAAFLAPLGVSV
jgi:thimet oligopeptidase